MMKYKIIAEGYGGEFTMGKVSPEFVEEWQDKEIDYDDVEDWYEIDDMEHTTSCYDDTEFVVVDENGKIVYEGTLECSHTRDAITFESGHEGYIPVMQCFSREKGYFFDAEFETDNFDPKKLKVKWVETDLAFLIEEVSYDGKSLDLDYDNYDTGGRNFEARVGWVNEKWHEKKYCEDE